MFPAAFEYQAPATLAEALSILKQRGDDAKVMAGGQSLIPLLKLRFARPEVVVDIGRLPAMGSVKRETGHVTIGALVRHVDVERSKELEAWLPMMVEASHWIADPLVRNRGTVAGSVLGSGIAVEVDFTHPARAVVMRQDSEAAADSGAASPDHCSPERLVSCSRPGP